MDELFNIISKELDVNGNLCDLLERYFKLLNKYEKQYAKEFDSKYDDYRDIDQKEKTDYINKELNVLSIPKKLFKLDSKKLKRC